MKSPAHTEMVFLLTAIALLGAPAYGQPTTAAQKNAAKQQAFISSKAVFKSNNYDLAETTLESGNKQAPNTPQWNVESGLSLMRMAFDLRGEGQPAAAKAAAQRALQQLTVACQASSGTTDIGVLAGAYELRGMVYEELLGNRASAALDYAAAINLDPKVGRAAVRLARLQQADAEEARKRTAHGRG